MGRKTFCGNFIAKPRAARSVAWRRLVKRGVMRTANWVTRYKLESELSRYRRTTDILCAQIINDFEALAYIRRRQDLVSAKLKGLHA